MRKALTMRDGRSQRIGMRIALILRDAHSAHHEARELSPIHGSRPSLFEPEFLDLDDTAYHDSPPGVSSR